MNLRAYLSLFFFSLLVSTGVASTRAAPAYMDSAYYYATGIQLAEGKGFTEPFLWNYLDNPVGIPHPSHAYWMPLTSIVAALGIRLAPDLGFASAKFAFILLSALIPLLTASLTFSLTQKRDLALIAALLAIFSGYYLPFLTTTDSFNLYMLLGGSFLLALNLRQTWKKAILLGSLAALMHLTRADGALWLLIAALALFMQRVTRNSSPEQSRRTQHATRFTLHAFQNLLILALAYALLITPWLLRNYATFGSPLAPNGDQTLWQTSYNQLFAYPAGSLSMQTWLSSGWNTILDARLWALKLNLGTLLGVQGGIILLPFIIIGAWQLRKNAIVYTGLFAWLVIFLVMTFIFPFAGARGGFFHSGAALQPLWWALAPVGLERTIRWGVGLRGWRADEANRVFQWGLVGMAVLLSGAILWGRVLSPAAREQAEVTGVSLYRTIEAELLSGRADPHAAVITSNPPAFYLASGRPALALPDGDAETLFALAERYGARYLVLEPGGVTEGLMPIFDDQTAQDGVSFLGEVKGAQVFEIATQ